MNHDSIVVPILGTGAAGFYFEDGARIVCEAIADYETTSLSDGRVIAYSQREHERLDDVADDVRSGG